MDTPVKRLFALKKVNGELVVGTDKKEGPLYFDSKMTAKKYRDEFNKEEYVNQPVTITPGPDHRQHADSHNYAE